MSDHGHAVAPTPPPPPPDVILNVSTHRHLFYNSELINCSFARNSVLLVDYTLQFDDTAYNSLSPFLSSIGIADHVHETLSRATASFYRSRTQDGNWQSFYGNLPVIYLNVVRTRVLSDDQLAEMLSSMAIEGEANFPASKASIESLEKIIVDESRIGDSCRVCLEELEKGEEVTKMPCSHVFHGDCIGRWLESSHVCPLCRFKLPTH